ncbi:MAG TPA: DNRLRE domain-containing protein [Candidatus Polarisedimenticolia bacterium]|nr:DNRLRE domain-containing protein [Candidatus Polarisedimenticolia bacterium]
MKRAALFLAITVLAGVAPLFAQTTVVLQGDPLAGEDTHLAQASSVQNFGAVTPMLTNSQTNGQSRLLLRFDLSGIPSGATIQSAVLELFYQSTRVSTSEPLRLHRVTRSWTEMGATWRTYDTINNWTSQGGDFDAAIVASATLDGTVNVWKSWTVTSLVQSWTQGTLANYGMLLESPSLSGNNERRFVSSESTTASQRPKLTITYVASDLSTSTKAVSSSTAVAGQVLTYTVVVQNIGNIPATSVVVVDTVDTTKLTSITPGQGGVLSAGTITWNSTTTPALASVAPAPGGNVTLSFTARVITPATDGTVISNQAILSSATQTNLPSDDPATAAVDDATLVTIREPIGNLYKRILEKNGVALPNDPSNPPGVSGALTTAVVPGDFLTYALFFTNAGSRDASSFVVRDGVPSWTDFVPDGFASGRGIRLILGGIPTDLTNAADADAGSFDAAATSNPDDPGITVHGLVTVNAGTLAAGASGSIRFKARVR